jgi:uncharacterized SAM-binding protein YcdF (DUF218 family)
VSRDLESRGVKAKNVLLEENSYDTVGNVILSYPAVKSFGASSIVFLAEKEMMNRIRKIADRVYGKSVGIIEESAEVALSVPYRVYNMVKEKVVYFVMFEHNFKDVRENDIAEFTRRLRATSLYRH